MAAMTEKQLGEFIDARLAPAQGVLEKRMIEIVEEALRKALDPVKQQQNDLAVKLAASGRPESVVAPVKKRAQGDEFGRVVVASVAAKQRGKPVEAVIEILNEWGDKDIAAKMVEGFEIRKKAMAAGDPLAGGVWVPPTISTDIIELLRPAVAVRKLNPTMVPMPTGTVNVPKITSGSTATYIGENINIPISQLATGQVTLTYKKLAALIGALMNANIPMTRCGWILSPNAYLRLSITTTGTGQYIFRDEMARGTLWGFPYAVTTHCPSAGGAAETYFADFDDVVIGYSMNLIVDSSMEAAYFDGSTLQSAFSLDQTLVRAISEADLGVRRAESVAVISNGTV